MSSGSNGSGFSDDIADVVDRLYIVIPAFNHWPQTKRCLDSLSASSHTGFHVIVVDHGSKDETKDDLPRLYPDVIHLVESESLWWAGAVNVGVREAMRRGARFIMLLNADCVAAPTLIGAILSHVLATELKVIAPVQYSLQTGKAWTRHIGSCFSLGFPTLSLPVGYGADVGRHVLIRTMMIVGGRGVVIPASVFDRVGYFDENRLPHYGADHDFYLRCRKHDVGLYVAGDAAVFVDEARSTLARDIGRLDVRQFIDTLFNRRSHRNVGDMRSLFRAHYPIRRLYLIGVTLNVVRYVVSYAWNKLFRVVFRN